MELIRAVILVVASLFIASIVEARVLRFQPAERGSGQLRHPNDVTYDERRPNDVTYGGPHPNDVASNMRHPHNGGVDVDQRRSHDVTTTTSESNVLLTSPDPPRVIPPRNPDDPDKLAANVTKRVLVIGGGLSGMSAALELAERGYDVTIREAGSTLGGRYSSRLVTVDKTAFSVDNSFTSWMSNNYQFLDIAKRLTLTTKFTKWNQIDYYFKTYQPETMINEHSYPLDILSLLWSSKNVKVTDVLKTVFESSYFVHFDYDTVYEKFDNIKFADWVGQQGIPKDFYDVFLQPISKELKNDNMTISAAAVMEYFYLYYLSTEQTAQADRLMPNLNNRDSLIGPWQLYLGKKVAKPVKIELKKSFRSFNFDRTGTRVSGDIADQVSYDYCILATGSESADQILRRTKEDWSGLLPAARALDRVIDRVGPIKTAPQYGSVRLWLNTTTDSGRPPVMFTPDMSPLNAVVLYHLFQNQSQEWASQTNGSVIELQLGVMEALSAPDYLEMACQVLPELCQQNASIIVITKSSSQDMPSLEVGQGRSRPNVTLTSRSGIKNLFLAGDWLGTGYPSAIGEKAISTGREAANEILLNDHVKQAALLVSSSHGPGWF